MTEDHAFQQARHRYALTRIQHVVDKPRAEMTDEELSLYTFASNALAGGDPVIPLFVRGPGQRLCRLCLAEWTQSREPEHVVRPPRSGQP